MAHPHSIWVAWVLAFLQWGIDQNIALSTIKGQVSALAVIFQQPLAAHSLICNFIQGVPDVALPVLLLMPPLNVNLSLSVLQKLSFESIPGIPLPTLSQKVAYLAAMTSAQGVSELAALYCKPPYLVIHKDWVVLCPSLSFLPKMVSAFHLHENIVLPSLCPRLLYPKEVQLPSDLGVFIRYGPVLEI